VKTIAPITVNVPSLLAGNKYAVDEDHAHIELSPGPSADEFRKLVMVCPAALYRLDEQNAQSFDYAGCLECGTCRVACGNTVIAKWEYPRPTMGVEYRQG
jgi:ferredoxin-like protein FixX